MENHYTVQLSEYDDPLDIRYDHIFKAVFTRETTASRGALSTLISALIEETVTVETVIANEPPAATTGEKRIRFDIACKSRAGELFNIEMSFFPGAHELERMEYFLAKLFVGQNLHGIDKDYGDIKKAYLIAVLHEKRFFDNFDLVNQCYLNNPKYGQPLGGNMRAVTLELCKASQLLGKPLGELGEQEAWAIFFEYLKDPEKRGTINEIMKAKAGIAMASEELMQISRDEEERARLLSEEKHILDNQSLRAEGRKEGRAEGREEGIEIGLERGRAEEIAKKDAEIAQSKMEIAKKLKLAGASPDLITQSTGLTLEAVVEL